MAGSFDQQILRGKTVLITGASGGIGLVTARELARRGAHLVLVCRNPDKAAGARAAVQFAAPGAQPDVLLCDFSLLANVRELAAEINSRYEKIDVLVNNVGIVPGPLTITSEGHELSWVTNHLAPFMLTNLILPKLVAAEQGRIITLASDAHWLGEIETLQQVRNDPEKYSSLTAYCDSKLANILFTIELANRLDLTKVTANCLHPGIVDTGLVNPNSSRLIKGVWWLARPFMINSERGAQTSIYLASSPEVAQTSGQYFKNNKPARRSSRAQNKSEASRLWRISQEETGIGEL
jgi:NAD(P)-dependent dehydrogenase (short-subunit alcohol dehydrogenase family)